MPTLHQSLGLHELLESADTLVPDWGLTHPTVGRLRTVDDVVTASCTGPAEERDEVLFQLARLASVDGDACREAAALLCHLLIPGVVSKVGRLRLPVPSDQVDHLAAQHLWIQCRSFPCARRPKVAPTIVWNVRRGVLADVGIVDRSRGDRTWANTAATDPELLDYWTELDDDPDPEEELADLLGRCVSDEVITVEQARLLQTIVLVSHRRPARRVTSHGLLSADVSRQVGLELGMGASTVRAKAGAALGALRHAVQPAA